MQILTATWHLLNQKCWGCLPEVYINKPSRWFRCTLKLENHSFNRLFSFQRLISFPNHSRWVAAPMLWKDQSISILCTDAKPSPLKDTPMKLLPDSDDLLICSAFHLASCLPLWDHMCRILRAQSQRSGWISVYFWVDWKAAAAVGKETQAAWAPCCFCLESKSLTLHMPLFSRGASSFQNLASLCREHYVTLLFCPLAVLDLRPCPFSRLWVGVWLSFWRDRGNEQVCENLRWPLPKSSKKLRRAPQPLVKCSLELRECLDFLPRELFHTLEHPRRKPQESGKPFRNRRHQEKRPSDPPWCWRHLSRLCFSVSCPVWDSRWSYTHNKPPGRVNCHPFHCWKVALCLLGPCPFQKHSACSRRGA